MYNNIFGNPYPGIIQNNIIPQINTNKVKKNLNVFHFKADNSGCSLYRMQMPEYLLSYSNQANIQTFTRMIGDKRMFAGVDVVRIQRQTTKEQLEYFKWLKSIQPEMGFRIIYEIDDIPLIDYIPLYNMARKDYANSQIQESLKQMMMMSDEITVTCDYMRNIFKTALKVDNITVIPNFQTKAWMGNMYNQAKINSDYDKNKDKPRILYCGSLAHYDVSNTGAKDDTSHIIDAIINNINEYQWVFLGGYPKELKSWVEAKKIEFHPWVKLTDYPEKLYNLNIQACIAPLANNDFNKAKSNIKFTEMLHYGIPVICQNIETYKDAWYKFDTGEDMIKLLNDEVKRAGHYKNLGIKHYKESKKWLLDNEENIGLYKELYQYPYGSSERKLLKKYNP